MKKRLLNVNRSLGKGLLTLLSIGLFAVPAMAQDIHSPYSDWEDQTLIKRGTPIGFYIGSIFKGSEMNGQNTMWVGGQVGLIADHQLGFGAAGYGLVTDVESNQLNPDGQAFRYRMGYGGLMLEPMILSKYLVHITTPILIGMGNVTEESPTYYDSSPLPGAIQTNGRESSSFFVVEPGVNLELNVARGIRFNFGAGYRYVSYSDLTYTSDEDLSALNFNFTLKLGWF